MRFIFKILIGIIVAYFLALIAFTYEENYRELIRNLYQQLTENKITFNNISKINRHKIINELANADLTSVFEIGEPIEHKILYMEYLNDLLNVKNIGIE